MAYYPVLTHGSRRKRIFASNFYLIFAEHGRASNADAAMRRMRSGLENGLAKRFQPFLDFDRIIPMQLGV
jgi:hypothetical protein